MTIPDTFALLFLADGLRTKQDIVRVIAIHYRKAQMHANMYPEDIEYVKKVAAMLRSAVIQVVNDPEMP